MFHTKWTTPPLFRLALFFHTRWDERINRDTSNTARTSEPMFLLSEALRTTGPLAKQIHLHEAEQRLIVSGKFHSASQYLVLLSILTEALLRESFTAPAPNNKVLRGINSSVLYQSLSCTKFTSQPIECTRALFFQQKGLRA
jgi:hypothetical protein